MQAVHEYSGDVLACIEKDGQIDYVSASARSVLGYEPDALKGRSAYDLIVEEDRPAILSAIADMVNHTASCQARELDCRLKHKDGRIIWGSAICRLFENQDDPDRTRILVNLRDMTRRHAALEKLQETEATLRKVLDLSPHMIFAKDSQGRFVLANRATADLFGRDIDDLIGHSLAELNEIQIEADQISGDDRRVFQSGQSLKIQEYYIDSDGKRHDISTLKTPLQLGNQTVVLGFSEDITESLMHRRQLDRSNQLLRTVINAFPGSIFVVDQNFRIVEISSHLEDRLLDKDPVPPVGCLCHERIKNRDTPCETCIVTEALESGQTTVRVLNGKSQYFTDGPCKLTAVPLRNDKPQPWGAVVSALDIADIVTAEREDHRREIEMHKARKFESLSVLARGLAHDYNNLLVAIMGNTDLALRQMEPDSPLAELLSEIKSASMRAADLTRQMLAYTGQGSMNQTLLDCNELLREVIDELNKELSSRITLQLNLDSQTQSVLGDREQLSQMIRNILMNSIEAIGEQEGQISVSTSSTQLGPRELADCFQVHQKKPGQYVAVTVLDTGCGMDETTVQQMFDPFFTTKFTGRGLGLAATLGILMSHHGTVKIDSAPQKGTSITLYLPAAKMADDIRQAANAMDYLSTRPRVLLADDDDTVRDVLCKCLALHQIDVFTVENGLQALRQFRANPYAFDLVLLDVVMPEMNGWQVLDAIRKKRPELPVFLCSGYDSVAPDEQTCQPDGFISKPFEIHTLIETLRAALNRTKSNNPR